MAILDDFSQPSIYSNFGGGSVLGSLHSRFLEFLSLADMDFAQATKHLIYPPSTAKTSGHPSLRRFGSFRISRPQVMIRNVSFPAPREQEPMDSARMKSTFRCDGVIVESGRDLSPFRTFLKKVGCPRKNQNRMAQAIGLDIYHERLGLYLLEGTIKGLASLPW